MALKAKKQSEKIREEIAKMDVAEAEMDRHRAELETVQSRVGEMSKAGSELHQALKDTLGQASPDRIDDIYRVYVAAKALAELLDLDPESK